MNTSDNEKSSSIENKSDRNEVNYSKKPNFKKNSFGKNKKDDKSFNKKFNKFSNDKKKYTKRTNSQKTSFSKIASFKPPSYNTVESLVLKEEKLKLQANKTKNIVHVNAKKVNAEALFNKHYKNKLFTEYPFFITPITEAELAELKEKIKKAFIAHELPKGTSEVKNAISFTSLQQDKKLYLCGYLDLNYEQMLLQLLMIKESKIPVVRLDLSLQHLVSDTTKDINLKEYPRLKSRRPYVCRAFIV